MIGLNKVKEVIKFLIEEFKSFNLKSPETYYLSIGENCLTDNILDRYNLKSFSTPYSHGRSNLDYAIELEREDYSNLLISRYLYYDYVGNTKVVRNNFYQITHDIYHDLHKNGFEFTHHDIINSESQRLSYQRKIMRMRALKRKRKIKFLYHYRMNDNFNLNLIIDKAKLFLSFYKNKNVEYEFIFFTQKIVNTILERDLTKIYDKDGVKGFIIYTLQIWEGDDQEVFWARKDDDLITKMIDKIR